MSVQKKILSSHLIIAIFSQSRISILKRQSKFRFCKVKICCRSLLVSVVGVIFHPSNAYRFRLQNLIAQICNAISSSYIYLILNIYAIFRLVQYRFNVSVTSRNVQVSNFGIHSYDGIHAFCLL